jgi:uncharacterized repeat protein (TIGR04076 family)
MIDLNVEPTCMKVVTMPRCKVTVLKKTFNQDLAEEYCQPGQPLCPYFVEGQEFIIDPIAHPGDGFCDSAWDDIYKAYAKLMNGGRYPGAKDERTIIACCSDGIRPVIFKLEIIEGCGR